ncbi:hypothetical protein [Nocardioides sp.]|uniref:hypothetical protein n=1 Tax=Nocardioides sp. TaxID=35761 RepID=UPI002CC33F63|nr:hypothetical protein [Nocardioides sp.]HXH77312.1 hypothetical protein [Nocardioides sp.]
MALTGILEEVTRPRLSGGHLRERQSEILDSTVAAVIAGFEELVRSSSLQVVLLTGPNPPAGPLRDLAAEIITLETASAIEYGEFPEQQVQGEDGRGYFLHQRALELLADLTRRIADLGGVIPADGGSAGVSPGLSPLGSFPPALPYPDLVDDTPRTVWWGGIA